MARGLLEEFCSRSRDRLLRGRAGAPGLHLEDVIAERGLTIAHVDLGGPTGPEAALDLCGARILINECLPQMCSAQANLMGRRMMSLGHELGHLQLHRRELEAGVVLGERHEREAYAYAMNFLLPREMLRADPSLWPIITHWQARKSLHPRKIEQLLDEVADRFLVTRGAVGQRLVDFQTLWRDGPCLRLRLPEQPSPRQPRPNPNPDTAECVS